MAHAIKLTPQLYINRELSWIRFNERVLEEAADTTHPLLERLKFLGIFSSNLDEFFMIRVGGLYEQLSANIHDLKPDGMSPKEQLLRISEILHTLIERQSNILTEDILPKLRKHKVSIKQMSRLRRSQKEQINQYFAEKVFPILTPLAIDSAHPVPQLRGLGMNILVEIEEENENGAAIRRAFVPIPANLPRFYTFETGAGGYELVLLEDIIEEHIHLLFPNKEIAGMSEFRLTRNADLDIGEDEADDLLKLIERELRKRRSGEIIRLEVSHRMHDKSRRFLQNIFKLNDLDVYSVKGHLALNHFMQLMSAVELPDIKDTPFTPALHPQFVQAPDIFAAIRKNDVLLHHPYDSFNPVVELFQQAATDPQVLAIKQTLYRTSGNSPIVHALKQAAENGKQVTALIELKARFDEENNITWAKELEKSGVNVVYGMIGLKIHCKVTLIQREEHGAIRSYIHLGTGNYNEKTATVYTDISYFTAAPDFGADIAELFNLLTGYSEQKKWRQIIVAPINMREQFKRHIDEAIHHHSPEKPSHIRLVMNSLVDPIMIRELYKASSHGVQIDMLVRGICCLVPGREKFSETITVRSIVGRFLEHLRVCCFEYDDEKHIYCGSADWMQRNLNRRIEVMFPIRDADAMLQALDILDVMFCDNMKARYLQPNGSYHRLPIPFKDGAPFSSQDYFLYNARKRQQYIDTTLIQ